MSWNDHDLDDPAGYDPDEGLDSGLDPEGPSAEDLDRFGAEMKTCPECSSEVYDQAESCHVCGHQFASASNGLPLWMTVVVATLIVAMLMWVF